MNKTFYITTPIYYPSDKLHIGHSYCTVATDVIARYKRLVGYDVMFLTGTDEHGQKIEQKSNEAKKSPQQFVDDVVASIKELWNIMDVSNDRFIRTTDKHHKKTVQGIFRELHNRGDIYKSTYKGKYCTPCESFWTDTQLDNGKCPDCKRDVAEAGEEAYFFRLSKYRDRILSLYKDNPGFLEPKSRMNEMLGNFIDNGLDDLCVSRTSFKWGIPVEFDDKHVVYVWIDALSNYISALGYGNDEYNDFDKYWPADVHIVGKEITRFHAIIWPAMLMALDIPLPKKIFAHGWLLLDGSKMSKSFGNVVDPVILCERYGVDALRYFLMREFPFGSDGVFSNESLINRINADLSNDLGNLVSRTASMIEKYFNGTIPTDMQKDDIDNDLIQLINSVKATYEECMESYNIQNALIEIFKLISRANKYIDETTPWILAKDEAKSARLASIMYNLIEIIRVSSIMLTPFMPSSCKKIQSQICAENTGWDDIKFLPIVSERTVKCAEILFPRIDIKKELEELSAKSDIAPSAPEGVISIDEFIKTELICAQILECHKIPKSKKLYKLVLETGGLTRQVVSGIAPYYTEDELINKKVMLVSNLTKAKLCGVESFGMILAATCSKDSIKVIFLDDTIPNGAKIG